MLHELLKTRACFNRPDAAWRRTHLTLSGDADVIVLFLYAVDNDEPLLAAQHHERGHDKDGIVICKLDLKRRVVWQMPFLPNAEDIVADDWYVITKPEPAPAPVIVVSLPMRSGFQIYRTDEIGFHSGRSRWRVVCHACGEVVHEATTGPEDRAESHLPVCKALNP